MIYILRSVLITFYFSLNVALAAPLASEILVWKPWIQVSTDLGRVPLKYSYAIQPGQIAVNSWNLNIPTIAIGTDVKNTFYKMDADGVQLRFDNVNLQLLIPSISLNQTIEQVINGSVFRVHVNSQCAPIKITNENILVEGELTWLWNESKPVPNLEKLNLLWTDESWIVSEIKCTGPMGINSVFLNQLQTNLKDRGFIQNLVYEKLKNEIQLQWNSFYQYLLRGQISSLPAGSVKTSLEKISVWNQNGVGVLGKLEMDIDLESIRSPLLSLSAIDTNRLSTQKVFLPKELVTLLAQSKIQATKIEKINLRENASFYSLLRSRFLQFFLWPDLMRFNKSAQFEIDFSRFSNLNLLWSNKNTAQVTGNLNAQMLAERDSNLQPYLDFSFGFSINAALEKRDQSLIIRASQPNINFSHRFNAGYIQRYKPSEHIASTIIKKGKKALAESIKIEAVIDLKSILGEQMPIKGFEFEQDNVAIDF